MRLFSPLATGLLVMLWTAILVGCSSTGTDSGRPQRTMAEVLARYGPAAEARLASYFRGAGVDYPPARLALLGFKAERRLELWADDGRGFREITRYRVQGMSGGPGPKLREGDRQVPEGIYRIIFMNPNSCCHLSMQLDYPNAFDLYHAAREGRDNPGGEIFIHGGRGSSGCLAVGDPAVEELFMLVARTGMENVEVIVAPHDFRTAPALIPANAPAWTPHLYRQVHTALARFPSRR